jgi:ATP-dependent 26S proteasome regulatory subunit
MAILRARRDVPKTQFLDELKLLIRSRYGLIIIESSEEDRVVALLRHLADQVRLPFFQWTRTKALMRDGEPRGVYGTAELSGAFSHIQTSCFPAVYLFHGMGSALEDPSMSEMLKDVVKVYSKHDGVVFLIGESLQLPDTLRPMSARVKLPDPDIREYQQLLVQVLRDVKAHTPILVDITKGDVQRLVLNLKGLTLMEAEKILTKALVVDQALTAKDIERVMHAKKDIIERDGLLEYYPLESTMGDIAALEGLKRWLSKRKNIILHPERARQHGLSFPKGVLLVGIPGTGKSLCAKAVAMEWKLPLLKMDPASFYNKYVGETEKNFRRAMDAASRMSPVVLWIDEIEKAFAASGGDEDGLTTRVLGTFLSWLQDRSGDVFVVATANDVSKLPPELLRKGRFDEIFFVDLPDDSARRALFRIHLEKRNHDHRTFDMERLAISCEGFTGADIEQVIISALYTSFDRGVGLSTELLVEEVHMTRPLTQTMPERISALRNWARERTVPAN